MLLHKKIDFSKILFVYIFLGVSLLFFVYSAFYRQKVLGENYRPEIQIPNQKITLLAKSYVIYDIEKNKIISGNNEKEVLPLASISKVISVFAYLDYKKNNNLKVDENVFRDINEILIESDNELIEELGEKFSDKYKISVLEYLPELTKRLSVSDIKMQNLSGLDLDEREASNFGSAESVAKIFSAFFEEYPEVFMDTKFAKKDSLVNTNQEVITTKGILASKTGFTDLAGGNLAVITTPLPNRTFVIVVLGSTKEGRFEDVKKLNEALPIILKSI